MCLWLSGWQTQVQLTAGSEVWEKFPCRMIVWPLESFSVNSEAAQHHSSIGVKRLWPGWPAGAILLGVQEMSAKKNYLLLLLLSLCFLISDISSAKEQEISVLRRIWKVGVSVVLCVHYSCTSRFAEMLKRKVWGRWQHWRSQNTQKMESSCGLWVKVSQSNMLFISRWK